MTHPYFSIIVPTHNRAQFISQTIISCLNQSFRDFELLIIDDGSTDNTREIVEGFNDKRVKYNYQQNSERAVARNHGVQKALGRYVFFLDSDDLIEENHLEKGHRTIHELNEPDFLFTGIKIFDGQTTMPVSKDFGEEINPKLLLDSNVCGSVFFLKRSFALSFPFKEIRALSGSEDRLLTLEISKETRLKYAHHLTYVIQDHEKRSMSSINPKTWINQREVLMSQIRKNKKFTQKEIRTIYSSFMQMVAVKLAASGQPFHGLIWYLKSVVGGVRKVISINSLRFVKYFFFGANFKNVLKHLILILGLLYSIVIYNYVIPNQTNRNYQTDALKCKASNSSSTIRNIVYLVTESFDFKYRGYTFFENPIIYAVDLFHPGVSQICDTEFLYENSTYAFCGQQSKTAADIAEILGIDYRYIVFKNHVALELKDGERWIFIDPTLALVSKDNTRGVHSLIKENKLKNQTTEQKVDIEHVQVLETNFPFFHKLEMFNKVSLWSFLVGYPLFLFSFFLVDKRKYRKY